MKMIQIFEKVTYGPFPMPFPSVNCASECFNLDYCILSWRPLSGCCYHYSYVNQPDTITFVETGKGENSIMAFKTIITGTTCPITYTEMNFTMTIPTDDTYSWKKIGNSWGLNGFRDGWTRFNRTSGISVCMKAFNVPNLWRSTALTWCEQENAIFVGMASIEESQWVHDQLDSSYNYYAYWVDGTLICSTTCNFSMLNYTDGFTTGSAALETTTNVHFELRPFVVFRSNYATQCILQVVDLLLME
ncbi:Protein CBG24064 [Caenorhabditis briggsae]|uniref:Protein CBG24064 n=1 Tax=Caenorhabditis briggsae TaxID=6238 RepID=A8WJW8_CAEBR|nr:Protein CBG24064 [Caenorhabditis briggsae]CAP20761.2 Protein CBG24064 [Caenorhabditis briggsae]